jgi:hypothetical protein
VPEKQGHGIYTGGVFNELSIFCYVAVHAVTLYLPDGSSHDPLNNLKVLDDAKYQVIGTACQMLVD